MDKKDFFEEIISIIIIVFFGIAVGSIILEMFEFFTAYVEYYIYEIISSSLLK